MSAVAAVGWVAGVQSANAQGSPSALRTHAACGPVAAHFARCHAVRVLNPEVLASPDKGRSPKTSTTTSATSSTTTSSTTTTTTDPTSSSTTSAPGSGACTTAHAGYTPCDLQLAYNLPSATAGTGQVVAIIDAYDDPTAESDLAVYRSAYNLPACTTANGCFRKVNQLGTTSKFPRADGGWAQEISLDVDMVSAACPNCKILLVEATTASIADLGTAERTAKALGATVTSNSWGTAGEFSSETSYDSSMDLGIPVVASSGDSGYGTSWPAVSPYVVAVGGTSLAPTANARGWDETAWSGAGSGCSAYETKPVWQTDGVCGTRAEADVSAVADPATGVAVYDTYFTSGWVVFGGTSVSSPIIASVYALAANATTDAASIPYANTAALNDVTQGSNGSCGSLLCNAGAGYDGPTGLGTPNGIAGF